MGTRIFVGNLSFNSTEGDILDLFKQAGNVTSCSLMIDKFTNKSRGFAFVEMATQDEANKAIAQFNGKELDGRALTVNEAKPREERSGGGFGGGGGGRDRGGGHQVVGHAARESVKVFRQRKGVEAAPMARLAGRPQVIEGVPLGFRDGL